VESVSVTELRAMLSARMSRRELLGWVVACLLANQTLQVLDTHSLAAFGASMASQNLIYWFACYVIARRLLLSDTGPAADRYDLLFGILLCGFVCLTSFVAYRLGPGVAATALAGYLMMRSNGDRNVKAAGSVLLALSANLVWAPIVFHFFAHEIILLDTALVGTLLRVLRPDIIWADTSFHASAGHTISLVGACSSFSNVSIALLAGVAMTMLLRCNWVRGDLAVVLAACSAMILLNAARLCVLAWSPESFAYWHEGPGVTWLTLAQTAVIAGVAYLGAVRAGQAA
jgi:hypothetical protein